MSSSEAVASRVTSDANVSVGTSIAMETILPNWPVFDPARVPPPKENVHEYTRVYFNLHTLLRNLYNAIPREGRDSVLAEDLASALVEEAWEVANAVETATANAVRGIIYFPSYDGIETRYPRGKVRQAVTPKQIAAKKLFTQTLEIASKMLSTNHPDNFVKFRTDLTPGTFGNTLLLTHMPVDLLSEYRFGRCALLESHTGVVKKRNMWYTKLFNGKQYPNMPFNAMSLQVLGDDHTFHPGEHKVKTALIEVATKHRWSWATSSAKMKLDIRGHPDAVISSALSSLL